MASTVMVFAGSAQGGIELVGGVHPYGRQAFEDGVLGFPRSDLEGAARAVRAGVSGRWVRHKFAVIEVPHGPGFFGAPAPAADADHLVVGGPFGEGVVGRMDDNESAAIADVLLELRAQALGPGRRIEIGHDDLVLAEVGMKAGEVAVRRWRGEHRDPEEPVSSSSFFRMGVVSFQLW